MDDDELEDPELAILRRKKMAKMIAREKKLKEEKERQQKTQAERERILQKYLSPNALSYLESLKQKQLSIASRIESIVLSIIVYRGLRRQIGRQEIRYIERRLKGEGPKIKIQRDGETSDFGSYVRKAIKKDEESNP
jgi:DNA-binding TFAR19-related protein (PDSD5 family)